MKPVPLSVVIVVYDMPHQIVRTVRSLSPAMQRGIAAEDYELVIVDNGSPTPIDRAACEAFGAAIRWIDVEDPSPSPAPAINLGIRAARGGLVGAFIDGARMSSPGMLAHALLAARLHDRPVISTLSYHLGSRPQYEAAAQGYDEAAEAALLATVPWEEDGYRLFDVSVPGHRGFVWFRRPFETNGLFMTPALWEELGGFDEAFASPGGGLVNPDVLERAVALPGVQVMSLLGEATFHQVHGGVSTNAPVGQAPLDDWHAEYQRLRGARFGGPTDPILCVGTPAPEAAAAMLRRGASSVGVGRRYVELLKGVLAPDAAGRARLDAIDAGVSAAVEAKVAGDVVICGGPAADATLVRAVLAARLANTRTVWLAAPEDPAAVAATLTQHDFLDERVQFLEGPVEDAPIGPVAVLLADGDGLPALSDRLAPGAFVLAGNAEAAA